MSLYTDNDCSIHFPAKPEKFEFDAEVASIFPDMASRSIPLWDSSHRLNARLAVSSVSYTPGQPIIVFDVGASTARFLLHFCNRFQNLYGLDAWNDVAAIAIDSSLPMLSRIEQELSSLVTLQMDITRPFLREPEAHIVNMSYVLQFIPDSKKQEVLYWLYDIMAPGATLFLSQKDTPVGCYQEILDEEYIRLRLRNGYTVNEIAAKTEALRNSMWTISHSDLLDMLRTAGFTEIQETSRWLHFNSLMCTKQR